MLVILGSRCTSYAFTGRATGDQHLWIGPIAPSKSHRELLRSTPRETRFDKLGFRFGGVRASLAWGLITLPRMWVREGLKG